MIPKYAKSIYGNKDAAAHVESLKLSGMASPIYRGVYIDINDKSSETEKARKYNIDLPPRTSPPSKLDSEPFEVHSTG